MMMNFKIVLVLAVTIFAGQVPAQARVVCPIEPMVMLPPSEGKSFNYGQSVVELLYLQGAADSVLASGTCSCDRWRPSWDTALKRYAAEYGELDYIQSEAVIGELQPIVYPKVREARALCRAQGVR